MDQGYIDTIGVTTYGSHDGDDKYGEIQIYIVNKPYLVEVPPSSRRL
jgi:hypothetical protein